MVKTRLTNVLRDVIIFLISIVLLIFLWEQTILSTLAIIVLYILRQTLAREKGDTAIYLTGAIMGTSLEIIAVRANIWQYTTPYFFGIPLWLPFAWGFVTVVIVRIALSLVNDEKE